MPRDMDATRPAIAHVEGCSPADNRMDGMEKISRLLGAVLASLLPSCECKRPRRYGTARCRTAWVCLRQRCVSEASMIGP